MRPGGHTVRRLLQAYARDPVFRDWATSAARRERLRQLIGPHVQLAQAHHNCVMTKQPRYSSVTGWHQDIRYWSFERPELVSVWLALGREHPGQRLPVLDSRHASAGALARAAGRRAVPARGPARENRALIDTRVTPLLEPGDVVFFHCRTFHAAGANRTPADEVLAGVHLSRGGQPAAARHALGVAAVDCALRASKEKGRAMRGLCDGASGQSAAAGAAR